MSSSQKVEDAKVVEVQASGWFTYILRQQDMMMDLIGGREDES